MLSAPSSTVTLMLFTTKTCHGCQAAKNAVAQVLKTVPSGQVELQLIDAEEDESRAAYYHIQSVPAVILAHRGRAERLSGPVTKQAILKAVQEMIGGN